MTQTVKHEMTQTGAGITSSFVFCQFHEIRDTTDAFGTNLSSLTPTSPFTLS